MVIFYRESSCRTPLASKPYQSGDSVLHVGLMFMMMIMMAVAVGRDQGLLHRVDPLAGRADRAPLHGKGLF